MPIVLLGGERSERPDEMFDGGSRRCDCPA